MSGEEAGARSTRTGRGATPVPAGVEVPTWVRGPRGWAAGVVLVVAAGSLVATQLDPEPDGANAVVRPIITDDAGVVSADAWPDACDLAAGSGSGAVDVRPRAGTLPDGTSLPGARSCAWERDGVRFGLEVKIVTTDVLEAWVGYQYLLPLRRPVSDIGDEAFVSPVGADGEEELWVCRGLTIFTVTAPGLTTEQARTELFAAGTAAVASLQDTRAGSTPPAGP